MGCAASAPAAEGVEQERRPKAAPPGAARKESGKAPGGAAAVGPSHTRKRSPTSPLDLGPESEEELGEEEEQLRLRELVACRQLDTPPERRGCLSSVPIAVVGLIDRDSLYLKSLVGADGRHAKRVHSFCDASLKAPNPTMMVVPDTLQDSRFQFNEFVNNPPYVRFYMGAPLVSSEGYVLGSLGLMDVRPRAFPAELCNLLTNFAELVVRELERDKAAEAERARERVEAAAAAARVARAALARAAEGAVRVLSVFQDAVVLCDTSEEGWKMLYCNGAFARLTGVDEPSAQGQRFQDLFPSPEGAAQAAARTALEQRRPFFLTANLGPGGPRVLHFRPATNDHISGSHIPLIGIPPLVHMAGEEELAALPTGLYFGVVESESAPAVPPASRDKPAGGWNESSTGLTSTASIGSSAHWTARSYDLEAPPGLGDLALGPMLGSGAHGRVYRGTWRSQKILDAWVDPSEGRTLVGAPRPSSAPARACDPSLEAALSRALTHPHLVETLAYDCTYDAEEEPWEGEGAGEGEAGEFAAKRHCQCWIVQAYCGRGTLLDAVDRGWLRRQRTLEGEIDMHRLLLTARDVASGLAFLHANSVLHGDLSGNNVLLAAAPDDPRGFVAKASPVGDFGLSRVIGHEQPSVHTQSYGTVSYMPPELLEGGHLGRPTDVYSLGVLCWEMYCCAHAWDRQRPSQIFHRKVSLRQELALPAGAPPRFKALVEACLSADPAARPAADAALATIEALLAEEEAAAARGGGECGGGGAPPPPPPPAGESPADV
eukprot:scaffold12.g8024.t1